MNKITTEINNAKKACAEQGLRLTPIREKVLCLLLEADKPMSAYDLLELYRSNANSGAQPMTIYRALSFLQSLSLVHHLASTRQYVACHHPEDHHHHQLTQFLMCDQCGHIEENVLPDSLWQAIQKGAEKTQFFIEQPNLEIHGTCLHCQKMT